MASSAGLTFANLIDSLMSPSARYGLPPISNGFTRDPIEKETYVSPKCEEEPGVGESEHKRQIWTGKGCGHVVNTQNTIRIITDAISGLLCLVYERSKQEEQWDQHYVIPRECSAIVTTIDPLPRRWFLSIRPQSRACDATLPMKEQNGIGICGLGGCLCFDVLGAKFVT